MNPSTLASSPSTPPLPPPPDPRAAYPDDYPDLRMLPATPPPPRA